MKYTERNVNNFIVAGHSYKIMHTRDHYAELKPLSKFNRYEIKNV